MPAANAVRPVQVKACCVVNAGVILSTLVATLIHATAITRSIPGCDGGPLYQPRQEWCFNANTKVQPGAAGRWGAPGAAGRRAASPRGPAAGRC